MHRPSVGKPKSVNVVNVVYVWSNVTCGPRVTARREIATSAPLERGTDQPGLEPCRDRPAGVYMEPELGCEMEIPVDIKTIGRTGRDSATI